jgi:hypothetical protein
MDPVNTGAPAPREPSFAERKAAQLAQERAARGPEPDPRPEPSPKRLHEPELEAAAPEPVEGGYVDEDEDEQYLEPESPDGSPEGSQEPDPEASVDWKSRYREAEKKISEVTRNRSAMEEEHANVMATTLQLRHKMEDTFTEARRYAEQYRVGFDNQIAQLEQAFTTGQIPPDQLPQARQHYQGLVNQRNYLVNQVQEIGRKEDEARKVDRERKAEIARVRLARTIPGWSREVHRELGEYAMSRGYTPEEFNENLDYRYLELLHDSMTLKRSAETVKRVRTQANNGGPRRNSEVPERGSDGKFRKARSEFEANPGQKGRFAEMKMRQLQKERRS